ncbi:hypothetical protein [Legionella yabuuchiae]|uniref:hypothetical protein n=1 Tax=Legionella yabuuchiae TaxID=376727 RepID=UPI0010558F5E|nr:hypothetical protein [Legionella yabuuchiae]
MDCKQTIVTPVREVIADRAYGSGIILSFLKNHQMHAFIPLFTTRSGNNNCSYFQGINFGHDKKTFVCGNNVLFHASKVRSIGFITYRTRVKDCRDCPFKKSCQAPIIKGRDVRVVSRHIHYALFNEVKNKWNLISSKKN